MPSPATATSFAPIMDQVSLQDYQRFANDAYHIDRSVTNIRQIQGQTMIRVKLETSFWGRISNFFFPSSREPIIENFKEAVKTKYGDIDAVQDFVFADLANNQPLTGRVIKRVIGRAKLQLDDFKTYAAQEANADKEITDITEEGVTTSWWGRVWHFFFPSARKPIVESFKLAVKREYPTIKDVVFYDLENQPLTGAAITRVIKQVKKESFIQEQFELPVGAKINQQLSSLMALLKQRVGLEKQKKLAGDSVTTQEETPSYSEFIWMHDHFLDLSEIVKPSAVTKSPEAKRIEEKQEEIKNFIAVYTETYQDKLLRCAKFQLVASGEVSLADFSNQDVNAIFSESEKLCNAAPDDQKKKLLTVRELAASESIKRGLINDSPYVGQWMESQRAVEPERKNKYADNTLAVQKIEREMLLALDFYRELETSRAKALFQDYDCDQLDIAMTMLVRLLERRTEAVKQGNMDEMAIPDRSKFFWSELKSMKEVNQSYLFQYYQNSNDLSSAEKNVARSEKSIADLQVALASGSPQGEEIEKKITEEKKALTIYRQIINSSDTVIGRLAARVMINKRSLEAVTLLRNVDRLKREVQRKQELLEKITPSDLVTVPGASELKQEIQLEEYDLADMGKSLKEISDELTITPPPFVKRIKKLNNELEFIKARWGLHDQFISNITKSAEQILPQEKIALERELKVSKQQEAVSPTTVQTNGFITMSGQATRNKRVRDIEARLAIINALFKQADEVDA